MGDTIRNEYLPDYVSPPGETLLETLVALGMSQAELAERTGRPKKLVNEIIKGKCAITPETALQLERALGVPASFWNNRERQYRETLARLEEDNRLKDQLDWLKKFPIGFMAKHGWIRSHREQVHQLRELLNFFAVASMERLEEMWDPNQVAYRRSSAFESDWGATIVWLRQGKIEAQDMQCETFNAKKFRKALYQVRELTEEPPETFVPRLVDLCARSGVAVTFVRRPPKAPVNGATRWLTSDKALVQLSLRYKTDDHLWFTFFHEAGHILLHGKRDVFIEFERGKSVDAKELEADKFAANILIPKAQLLAFKERGDKSKRAIRQFASELGIAPGIVVGRLQHDRFLLYSHCNDLKRHFEWSD